MSDDAKLLQSYVEERSERAFSELVKRHIDLVYHAALRHTGGNAHSAQDVTQAVFVDLARKARSLTHRPVLTGWLFTSTRYAAAQVVRAERRRQAREEGAQFMNELIADSGLAPDWNQLRPVIDDALHELSERDREAVLLRFFEGKPFAELGAKFAISENTARVRVDRALDKLRKHLARRGVTSTSAALATLLANQALASAPTGLAIKISGAAYATVAAMGGTTALATFMGMTKLHLSAAAVLVVAGGTVIVQQQRARAKVLAEIGELQQQQAEAITLHRRGAMPPPVASNVTSIQPELTDLSTLRAQVKLLQEEKEEADSYKAQMDREAKRREESRKAALLNKNLKPEEQAYAPIFKPSDLDVRPKLTTKSYPVFSAALEEAFREKAFQATAHAIVDTTGRPQVITVTDATSPEFAAAVQDTVSRLFFSAGQVNGKPVSSWLTMPFRINQKGPPANSSAAALRKTSP